MARNSKAAQEVADLIASPQAVGTSPINSNADRTIPKLLDVNPDNLSIHSFDPSNFDVSDPLNPPESLPRASSSQLERGTRIYQEAQNAVKLYSASFDLAKEKFNAIGKFNKAVGAGIAAAIEAEKVRGQLLDYESQKQLTQQKSISLNSSVAMTQTNQKLSQIDQQNLDQKLAQAQLKADQEKLKTQQLQGQLVEFQKLLGGVA